MEFAKILPFTYTDPLTYSIPKLLAPKVRIGQIVKIPLGRKETKGVIFEITKNRPQFKTKPILEIPNLNPLFTATQIKLAEWLGLNYFSSLYQVLRNIKPENLENLEGDNKQIKNNEPKKIASGKKIILLGNNKKEASYLRLVSRFLKAKRQVLILFPDYSNLEIFLQKVSKNIDFKKTAIITGRIKKEEKAKE